MVFDYKLISSRLEAEVAQDMVNGLWLCKIIILEPVTCTDIGIL
jgi:hypothetical protein